MAKSITCVLCKKRTSKNERRPVSKPIQKFLQKELGVSSTTDMECGACRIKFYKAKKTPVAVPDTVTDDEYEPPQASTSSKQFISPPSVRIM